ncbi:MAG: ABC transporter ATP-binding protein [Candidatus Verstraetearchaeota archaeon]|jgi:ABC-2 type transport system ATP-binding protein|nr:ABC transporter ATP-binding protein [Candidatus Verstraetearchaeota archaeon]
MAKVVVVRDLVKQYPGRRALDGITFEVEEGEIFGLIGPNGAGKTTTLRILATIIKPTSGHVEICGKDVLREGNEVRRLISYLPEEAGAYSNLSGLEYLRFMASFYYDTDEKIRCAIEDATAISGLGDRLKEKTSNYSKGMRRRLLLARTLMVKPRLAILDEPTSGLDVTHAYHLRRVIKSYSKEHGTTVLISSHNMLEVEYLCDRVALIDQGKIVETGSPEYLKSKYSAANLEDTFMKVVGFAQGA